MFTQIWAFGVWLDSRNVWDANVWKKEKSLMETVLAEQKPPPKVTRTKFPACGRSSTKMQSQRPQVPFRPFVKPNNFRKSNRYSFTGMFSLPNQHVSAAEGWNHSKSGLWLSWTEEENTSNMSDCPSWQHSRHVLTRSLYRVKVAQRQKVVFLMLKFKKNKKTTKRRPDTSRSWRFSSAAVKTQLPRGIGARDRRKINT